MTMSHCRFIFSYQLSLVLDASAGVAVGIHEQLGVGVDGDEGLNVARLHKVHNGFDLRLRMNSGPTVDV